MNERSVIMEKGSVSVPFSASVLVSECSWEKLFSELQVLLQQLDFVCFSYSSVPRDIGLPDSLFALNKRRYGVDTLGTIPEAFVSRYYKEIAGKDPIWNVLPSATQPFFALTQKGTSTPVSDAFWEHRGICSRIYVPVGNQEKSWFNYFGLYHRLPYDEFVEVFGRIKSTLIPLLERCHKLLQLDGSREMNPFVRHTIFSDTCRNILDMTAEGMSVKMIADTLELTEEGVTYHITRAKKLLQARNKTQLIARLYQTGVL